MTSIRIWWPALDNGDQHEDIGDEDDHLCRRSLIDPGRWRAPALSSWSPFFIHNSRTSKCPQKIRKTGHTVFQSKSLRVWTVFQRKTGLTRFGVLGVGVLGRVGYFQRRLLLPTATQPPPLPPHSIDFKDDPSRKSPPAPTQSQAGYYPVLRKVALSFSDVENLSQWPVCVWQECNDDIVMRSIQLK